MLTSNEGHGTSITPTESEEGKGTQIFERPCSIYGYKSWRSRGRQWSVWWVFIILDLCLASSLTNVHWRNNKTIVSKYTQVRRTQLVPGRETNSVLRGIIYDRVTQQFMRKFESCWKECCVITPTGSRAVLCHWPASLWCVLLSLVVTLNMNFAPTLNDTQSIYFYKLL